MFFPTNLLGPIWCVGSTNRSQPVGKCLLWLWLWSLWVCSCTRSIFICIWCLCWIWAIPSTGKNHITKCTDLRDLFFCLRSRHLFIGLIMLLLNPLKLSITSSWFLCVDILFVLQVVYSIDFGSWKRSFQCCYLAFWESCQLHTACLSGYMWNWFRKCESFVMKLIVIVHVCYYFILMSSHKCSIFVL